jgi:hypothetical protein
MRCWINLSQKNPIEHDDSSGSRTAGVVGTLTFSIVIQGAGLEELSQKNNDETPPRYIIHYDPRYVIEVQAPPPTAP